MDTVQPGQRDPQINPSTISGSQPELNASEMRLLAVQAVARHHGFELDRTDYHMDAGDTFPSPLSLVKWLRDQGLVAKASRLAWPQLFRLTEGSGSGLVSPVVLLFNDGTAGVLVGSDTNRDIVWIRDPRSTAQGRPWPSTVCVCLSFGMATLCWCAGRAVKATPDQPILA